LIKRWNQALEDAGLDQRLTLPHEGFNRKVGAYAGSFVSPDGTIMDEASWQSRASEWLPTTEDKARVAELMKPEYEPGKFASWIAPPQVGINSMPVEFDYVHF
jgi:benzoyl-CoA 2,3-dioxygenase component B